MRVSVFVSSLAVLLATGCVSTGRDAFAIVATLESLPEYPAVSSVTDTSSRLCVYNTLRFGNQLADALKGAGYPLAGVESFATRAPKPPDFVIEPLTFDNRVVRYRGELWLDTRVTVTVRRPMRMAPGTSVEETPDRPKRVFQAYARKNLGARTHVFTADYVANEGVAVGNLVRLDEFRRALLRDRVTP